MDFVTSIKTCLKKYAVFSGRATRSEFWYFYIFATLVYTLIQVIAFFGFIEPYLINSLEELRSTVQATTDSAVQNEVINAGITNFGVVWLVLLVLSIPFMIPVLSAMVRRLHDTGRPGAYYFMSWIPYIGPFILLIALVKDTTPCENKYGPNPKELN